MSHANDRTLWNDSMSLLLLAAKQAASWLPRYLCTDYLCNQRKYHFDGARHLLLGCITFACRTCMLCQWATGPNTQLHSIIYKSATSKPTKHYSSTSNNANTHTYMRTLLPGQSTTINIVEDGATNSYSHPCFFRDPHTFGLSCMSAWSCSMRLGFRSSLNSGFDGNLHALARRQRMAP